MTIRYCVTVLQFRTPSSVVIIIIVGIPSCTHVRVDKWKKGGEIKSKLKIRELHVSSDILCLYPFNFVTYHYQKDISKLLYWYINKATVHLWSLLTTG